MQAKRPSVRFLFALACAFALARACEAAEDAAADAAWTVSAAGGVLLPGNAAHARRAAEATARGAWWATDALAFEATAGTAPNAALSRGGNGTFCAVGAGALWRLSGWREFDMLFGCERFDPFFAAGVAARWGAHGAFGDARRRTAIGPAVGCGAFYHLTNRLSLRFDAAAQMGCGSPCGVDYSVSAGLAWTFGGVE